MHVPVNDRAAIFEAAAIECFRFLETDYGFSRRVMQFGEYSKIITYESASVYVTVGYGPPDYEPSMWFGRRGVDDRTPGHSFGIEDLEQWRVCLDQVSGRHGWIAKIAHLLRNCGAACLSGNSSAFAAMEVAREARYAELRSAEALKTTRAKIDAAWKVKDYKEVVRLCASIDDPSELDRQRFSYAKARS